MGQHRAQRPRRVGGRVVGGVAVAALVCSAASASAVSAAGSRSKALTLTVAPASGAQVGDVVVLRAHLRDRGSVAVIGFFDGANLLGTREHSSGSGDQTFATTDLERGTHVLRIVATVVLPKAARLSAKVTYTVQDAVVDARHSRSDIDVRVPVVHLPPRRTSAPETVTLPPPRVGAVTIHRGRLAFTGADIVRIVLLALALLALGLAARWTASQRRRRLAWGLSLVLVLGGGGWAVAAHTSSESSAPTAERAPQPAPSAPQDAGGWTPWDAGSAPQLTVAIDGGPPLAGAGTVRPASRLRLVATGFAAGEHVSATRLAAGPVPDAELRADGDGQVVYSFAVPSALRPGPYTVVLHGRTITAALGLTVTA